MDENRRKGAEEFLQQQEERFRRSAFLLINEIVYWYHPSVLVDECLHSVFFSGIIHKPNAYRPEDIVSDEEMLRRLKEHYPQPFEFYLTQLPKRSPFSCVLDMIVSRITCEPNSEEGEHDVKKSLQNFTRPLREKKATELISSTICISQKPGSNSDRYYGVSMSTKGRDHGQIMVAVSCLSTWDSYVADAVMTYNPDQSKKVYFDGTLQLQELIRCEAFKLSTGERMDPCKSCGNLFGLKTGKSKGWPYGHCAEAESISNLLKNEDEVRQRAEPTSETYTDKNRERAKESVMEDLKKNWKRFPEFYKPCEPVKS